MDENDLESGARGSSCSSVTTAWRTPPRQSHPRCLLLRTSSRFRHWTCSSASLCSAVSSTWRSFTSTRATTHTGCTTCRSPIVWSARSVGLSQSASSPRCSLATARIVVARARSVLAFHTRSPWSTRPTCRSRATTPRSSVWAWELVPLAIVLELLVLLGGWMIFGRSQRSDTTFPNQRNRIFVGILVLLTVLTPFMPDPATPTAFAVQAFVAYCALAWVSAWSVGPRARRDARGGSLA